MSSGASVHWVVVHLAEVGVVGVVGVGGLAVVVLEVGLVLVGIPSGESRPLFFVFKPLFFLNSVFAPKRGGLETEIWFDRVTLIEI